VNTLFLLLKDWEILLLIPALSLIGLALVSRVVRLIARRYASFDYDSGVIDTATQNTMSGAFVILSFSFVLVMGNVDKFDTEVTLEASQIHVMDQMLSLLHSPAANQERHRLLNYTESLVNDEWPILGQARGNRVSVQKLEEFLSGLKELKQGEGPEEGLFVEIVKQSGEIVQSRDIRILNASTNLPDLFWIVNTVSLLVVIVVGSLRLAQPSPPRVIVIICQIIMINLLFSAVLIIDNPFKGQTRISSWPLQRTAEKIRHSLQNGS
jgi:hypothetical protein